MNNNYLISARSLSDTALQRRLADLATRERAVSAELIAHLAELDARRLHLAAGYGSLFAYCREVLRLSESEAYSRIKAARAARKFPAILDGLESGAVNLTAVRLLAPHFTASNHVELLESARGASKRQVEQLVARLAPRPDVAPSIRKLPAPATVSAALTHSASPTHTAQAVIPAPSTTAPPSASAMPTPPVAARPALSSLSPDRYKLQLTITNQTREKLELAKDLLRHALPSCDESAVLERALDLLLADLARKKFAATDRPRRSSTDTDATSRHVPAEVRRAVFLRDLGRCAYAGTAGHRCNERAFVELHHVRPYAEGGPATVDNLELRCRRHNEYEWHLRSTDVRQREEDWRATGSGTRSRPLSHRLHGTEASGT